MARVRIENLDSTLEKRFWELVDKEDVGFDDDDEEREYDALSEWYNVYEDYLLATLDIVAYYEDMGIEFVH